MLREVAKQAHIESSIPGGLEEKHKNHYTLPYIFLLIIFDLANLAC